MSTDMQQRMKWSIDMQERHALSYYKNYWSDIQKITEVDKLGEDSDDMQHLDFSGIDKIIHTKNGSFHIAQRFRQMRNMKDGLKKPDFSLRYETYNDAKTEYQKLKEAYNGLASTPQVYGFGITPHGRQVAKNKGFKEFYLIDFQMFLKNHFDGRLSIMTKAPNGDGSMGAYFDIAKLEGHDCILEKWPKPKGPTQLSDFM